MGTRQGWTVQLLRGTWRGRVRDRGTYRSKAFATKTEATRWAQDQAAAIRQQRAVVVVHGSRTEVLAREYIEDLERRGRSAVHLHDTGVMLGRVAQAVPDLASPAATGQIEAFLRSLAKPDKQLGRKGPLSPRTRNKYLVSIKSLCNWAVARRRLEASPAAVIGEVKEPGRLAPQFSVGELRHLLEDGADPYHLTFAVLIFAGLRITEATTLTWGQIDLAAGFLRVTGKGDKERRVPIQAELRRVLTAARRPNPDEAVCPPMCASVRRDFKRFLKRQLVAEKGRTPHATRHTYAGLMTATGVPSILLAVQMGHASTATTAGYARLADLHAAEVKGWERGEFKLLPAAAKVAGEKDYREE